jgi:hypothetical protein
VAVPETVEVQKDIRRTISGTEGLALALGGLAHADRDASDASTPHVLSSYIPRELLKIPISYVTCFHFPSTLLLVIYELYSREYTNKVDIYALSRIVQYPRPQDFESTASRSICAVNQSAA